jgi:hypothetical protein
MGKSTTRRRGLIDEIERYLAAVDVFRALGCEPTWIPEPEADTPIEEDMVARYARTAH